MACDGVWDVMANDEACFFLRKYIQEGNRDLGKILEDMEVGIYVCLGMYAGKQNEDEHRCHPLFDAVGITSCIEDCMHAQCANGGLTSGNEGVWFWSRMIAASGYCWNTITSIPKCLHASSLGCLDSLHY